MLTFLRKIRRKLLDEGNLRRYLVYAFGEILLVVAGILIALSINNWNDGRKERILEREILREISVNLEHDLYEIRVDISLMDSINRACNAMITIANSSDPPPRDIKYLGMLLRATPHFDPNKSGYSLLTSKGVEVVQDDSLRGALSLLYESRYPYYRRYEEERIDFMRENVRSYLLTYFSMHWNDSMYFRGESRITEADLDALRKDDRFIKVVQTTAFENTFVQFRARSIEEFIQTVLTLIEEALAKK